MNTHGRKSIREDADIHAASAGRYWREPIRPEGVRRNRVRVGWIAVDRVQIDGSGIDNAGIRRGWRVHPKGGMHNQAGIIDDIRRNRDFLLIVVQAVTAPDYQFVFESCRAPCKTELGAEVIFLSSPGLSPVNDQPGEVSRSGTGGGHKHVVLFRGEWAEVRPAQAKVESEVRPDFIVVLNEEAPDVCALILAIGGRKAGPGIEVRVFGMRRVVEKVPNVKEGIIRDAATGALLQVKKTRDFAAKLDGVVPENLGGHVLVSVGPLVQNAADVRSELADVGAVDQTAGLTNGIGGKSNW